MKTTETTNGNITSRVIPGLTAEHRIVSLPYWAWFWLDDFMQQNRLSYQGMLKEFDCQGDVNNTLRGIAELHQEHCMRGMHNLSNDNVFLEHDDYKSLITRRTKSKNKTYNFPRVYKLFNFIPCTTTLEAVWTRRNYNENNQVN